MEDEFVSHPLNIRCVLHSSSIAVAVKKLSILQTVADASPDPDKDLLEKDDRTGSVIHDHHSHKRRLNGSIGSPQVMEW
jgi:hypothetical protein